ncbi:MAG: 1-acyl-sn-glycerol-3-phosphate acyltransferase [Pseudonocardiaceae bacterium]|nr:1-acyl-sn-glycerol-3-phosphate acyltransferase [Pseudonocardiaceae bacterium]
MNGWTPRSPCSPRCARPAAKPVSLARTAGRCLATAVTLACSSVVVLLLPVLPVARDRVVSTLARALLRAAGVRLRTASGLSARDSGPGTLIVANHISWLDILAVLATEPATFLAKREVRGWPLLGPITAVLGTQYVARDRLRELPHATRQVAATLRAGRSVVVFPEGTTWCRPPGGTFRRAPFQAAIDAGAPVRPVSIRYTQGTAASTVTAFVGDDALLPSVLRVARAGSVTAWLHPHPMLTADGRDRRELAAAAQATVSGQPAGAHAGGGHPAEIAHA